MYKTFGNVKIIYLLCYMQLKKCKSKEGCTNYPAIGKGGYCHEHQTEDVAYERKQIASQRKKAEKIQSAKLRKEFNPKAIGKGVDAELEKWFADIAKQLELKPICWECKKTIPKAYFRAATAHILQKSIFKSVATHPNNFVIACASNGCHKKTEQLDTLVKMKIYPIIRERFLQLLPIVKEKHKYLNNFIDLVNDNQ